MFKDNRGFSLVLTIMFFLVLISGNSKVPGAHSQILVSKESGSQVLFKQAHSIMKRSCMPCHNKHRVSCLAQAIKRQDFKSIDGESRLRIVSAIKGLSEMIDEGMNLSFTSEKEIKQFLKEMPGGLYTMVDKGVMPPPWAPDLMKTLYLHTYRPLSVDDRIVLQKFAVKHSP